MGKRQRAIYRPIKRKGRKRQEEAMKAVEHEEKEDVEEERKEVEEEESKEVEEGEKRRK